MTRTCHLATPVAMLALVVALAPPSAYAISHRILIAPTGAAAGDHFGSSVSGAGDVNGDGYDDIIVAAWSGQANVYFGGPPADAVADLTLTGVVGDDFGRSVSEAGDVNGDGYGDVIVGAPNAGRAFLYYGGPGADAVADLTLTGAEAADAFGWSVSGAGDVNGDGYDDVIVGAMGDDAGGSDAGRAYVFYGGPGADAVADLTLTGAAADNLFGNSVSGAGDVNGDDHDDVIVGAFNNDAGGAGAGRAYVYYGGPGADAVADLTLTGAAVGDNFGWSVSGAGDVNGDGYEDVIVGASANDAGGTDAGRTYVYYGGLEANAVADLTLTGTAAFDYFGHSVSGAGDVNGDGHDDVIVGAVWGGGSDAGLAYVYYGGPGADAVADLTLTGAAGDNFGGSVSGAGDVNGDGYDDVIVGAFNNDAGGLDAGRAYVMAIYPYQVLAPNGGEEWVVGRPATVRWRGHDVADLAISHDGGASWSTLASGVGGLEENEFTVIPALESEFAKVRVSVHGQVPQHSNSDQSDGVFRIVMPLRPPLGAARLLASPQGLAVNEGYGSSVASAGDMNGDGYGDFVVGSPNAGGDGRAYVFYGGPGSDGVADLILQGINDGNTVGFGVSVASAGDMNADGYGDVIVGAQDDGTMLGGRAFVFHGGPTPDAVADLALSGGLGDTFGFGISVSSAGDVNRDGYGDVIIGDHRVNGGQGAAYVFHGGPVPEGVPDVALHGETDFDQLGASVSFAGDWNQDGYDDVVVGSGWFGSGRGAAFVYFLGPGSDTVADITLGGATANSHFGASLAAGDTNGDGFEDVIVGAFGHASFTGRAYVFHGGLGGDGVADLTLSGELASDNFGLSVGFAGDVNADGFGDIVTGAYGHSSQKGRAYVYHGGPGADATADLVLDGDGSTQGLGNAVASAGDINRDGFGDLVVGASAFSSNRGRAHVFTAHRFLLTAPNGGDTWNVGATKTITWLGAEPADLWLSVDGGLTHQIIEARVGGEVSNSFTLRVPHTPTKFAIVKVAPADASVDGFDRSDSLFTIQTSVSLLAMLAAPAPEGASGATISWRTDPGPDDLAGYRLERAGVAGASADWRTIVPLTRETAYTDPEGGPGARYRLFAVNGFGEEILLGEAAIRPAVVLSAWPLPYRGGELRVSYATAGGLGGGSARTELAVYDVHGRLVRTIDAGAFPAGHRVVTWNGRDSAGREAPAGVYFLRTRGDLGYERTMKITVLR